MKKFLLIAILASFLGGMAAGCTDEDHDYHHHHWEHEHYEHYDHD